MLESVQALAFVVLPELGMLVKCDQLRTERCISEGSAAGNFSAVEVIDARAVEGRGRYNFVRKMSMQKWPVYLSIFIASSRLSYLKALHPSLNRPTILAKSL